MKIFGINEFGARAFHGLTFVLTVLIVIEIGTAMWDRVHGLRAGAIYSTMILPVASGSVVTVDATLAMCAAAAFYCFWRSVDRRTERPNFWKMAMCLCFGLGFVAKGPAILILSAPMFAFLAIRHRVISYFVTPWAPVGLVLFCVVGLSWYAVIADRIPGALEYFWDNQVEGRLVTAKYGRNPEWWKGPVIYLPAILLGSLPWSFLWIGSLVRSKSTSRLRFGPTEDSAFFLSLLWVAVPLAVLMLASSKLVLYSLPVFPAIALILSRIWPSTFRRFPNRFLGIHVRSDYLAIAASAIFILTAKGVFSYYPPESAGRKDTGRLWETLQPYLPDEPFEIIFVDDKVNGLSFYTDAPVERVTLSEDPYPFFAPTEQFSEEVREIQNSGTRAVFVVRRSRRAKLVRRALDEAQIGYEETSLPFRRYLFVCEDLSAQRSQMVSLVALGDIGKAGDTLISVANALAMLAGENDFEDGVLLLGDLLYGDMLTEDNIAKRFAESFEKPFYALLDSDTPIFSILGNHDEKPPITEFLVNHPRLGMNGLPYRSEILGGGLVELFLIRSQSLRHEAPDADQLRWLDSALGASRATWKIVLVYHPPRSTSMRREEEKQTRLRNRLEPLFIRNGVSLVLSGHNHYYERLAEIDGINYVTVGGTAKLKTRDLEPGSKARVVGIDDRPVFVHLDIRKEEFVLTAYDDQRKVVDRLILAPDIRANSP